MLRSAWLAQELLQAFPGKLHEVALRPVVKEPGGDFTVAVDDFIIWDRRVDGGFPETAEIVKRTQDRIERDRSVAASSGLASTNSAPFLFVAKEEEREERREAKSRDAELAPKKVDEAVEVKRKAMLAELDALLALGREGVVKKLERELGGS